MAVEQQSQGLPKRFVFEFSSDEEEVDDESVGSNRWMQKKKEELEGANGGTAQIPQTEFNQQVRQMSLTEGPIPLSEELLPEVWDALNVLDQIQPTIAAGPRWKLDGYLAAMDDLQRVKAVMSKSGWEEGIQQTQMLQASAMDHLLEEFADALEKHSKPMTGNMIREVAMTETAGALADPPTPSTRSPSLSGTFHRHTASEAFPDPNMHRYVNNNLAEYIAQQQRSSSGPVKLSVSAGGASGEASAATGVGGRPEGKGAGLQVKIHEGADNGGGDHTGAKPSNAPSPPRSKLSLPTKVALQEWLPRSAVPWLHRMFNHLVAGGAEEGCLERYALVRCAAVRKSIAALGMSEFDRGSLDRLSWKEEIEPMLKRWVRDFRALVLVLLCGEKTLCIEIMEGEPSLQEQCFRLLANNSGIPEALQMMIRNCMALASSKPIPERLFALLEIYATVKDLLPEVERVYAEDFVHKKLVQSLAGLRDELGLAVITSFEELKRFLEESPVSHSNSSHRQRRLPWLPSRSQSSEPKEDAIPLNGGIHKIASWVVNFISAYIDRKNYRIDLEELFYHCGSMPGQRSVEKETFQLVDFLMRNLATRAKRSEWGDLGSSFSGWKDGQIVEDYLDEFVKAAFAKVSVSLTESSGNKGDGDSVKHRLKKFNNTFEELALKQGSWNIIDEEKRKKVRAKLAAVIKEKYASFLLPYREDLLEYRSYRYTPDSVERMVLDYFFLGSVRS
eukprot:TRINITY_DN6088_c0_g1_i1.p1 TRINITY_DN6088_c0_g1~~TRINITY_DN6088_c0_g1_i1.p1  ORF type:complete len:731 (-),score=211.02 TRINITY_DN6088_c0_g1_i1:281-2473(-)